MENKKTVYGDLAKLIHSITLNEIIDSPEFDIICDQIDNKFEASETKKKNFHKFNKNSESKYKSAEKL